MYGCLVFFIGFNHKSTFLQKENLNNFWKTITINFSILKMQEMKIMI